MDKTQISSSLPRRLPRQPKAAPQPGERAAEDHSLAPNISYFPEEVEARNLPELGVSAVPLLSAPVEEQTLPPSTEIVEPVPIADPELKEQAVANVEPVPTLENRRNRPSDDDPKPGYARLSGASRSRPSRPSGISRASRPSVSVPAVPENFDRRESEAREVAPLGVSQEHPVSIVAAALLQETTQDKASRPSIPVRNNDTATPSAPLSRVVKSPSRRAAHKRKIPGGIALAVLSCVLVAYSFSVGSIENEVDRLIVNSESMPAFMKSILPWFPMLPLILLLGTVLWILAGMIGLRRTRHRAASLAISGEKSAQQKETKRRKAPLELFRDEAEKEGFGKDAAYQVWRLLQRYGPDSHILSIYDDLQVKLGMTQHQIQRVYQQLVPANEGTVSPRSVLDLMRLANAPRQNTAQRPKTAQ